MVCFLWYIKLIVRLSQKDSLYSLYHFKLVILLTTCENESWNDTPNTERIFEISFPVLIKLNSTTKFPVKKPTKYFLPITLDDRTY